MATQPVWTKFAKALADADKEHLSKVQAREVARKDATDKANTLRGELETVAERLSTIVTHATQGNVGSERATRYAALSAERTLITTGIEALENAAKGPKTVPATDTQVAEVLAGVIRNLYGDALPVLPCLSDAGRIEFTASQLPIITVQQKGATEVDDKGLLQSAGGLVVTMLRGTLYAPLEANRISDAGKAQEAAFLAPAFGTGGDESINTSATNVDGMLMDSWHVDEGARYAPALPVLPEALDPLRAGGAITGVVVAAINGCFGPQTPTTRYPVVPVGASNAKVTETVTNGKRVITSTITLAMARENAAGLGVTMYGAKGQLSNDGRTVFASPPTINGYELGETLDRWVSSGQSQGYMTNGLGRLVDVTYERPAKGITVTITTEAAKV